MSALLAVEAIDTLYGKSHVLHGLSLAVGAGEIVALLGRNGAGKTTTMRSIMGMSPPKSGQIRFEGHTISGLKPHQIFRRGVRLVPQGRRIFPQLSVHDNLRLATFHAGLKDVHGALEQQYARFPPLRQRKGFKAGHLSGGERQMLAIARALLGQPKMILFDEPSEGLAPRFVGEIRDVIRDIASGGIAILLAEQNVRMALSIASRSYVIDKGQVRFEGTSADIEHDKEVKTYLGVSARPLPSSP